MNGRKVMARRIGIAIFGLGRIGTIHFENLLANYRTSVKWLVEEDLGRANTIVKKYYLEDTRVTDCKNISCVLEDSSVDAIVVCTPTHTHEDIVRAALRAGKHVFCEKPICATTKATHACYDDAEKYKRALYCGFNRRFDPAVRKVCHRVKAGDIGEIQLIKMTARDYPPPSIAYLKHSGGIFHDSAIHDLDVLSWIVGETATSVYVQAHCFNKEIAELGDVDTAITVLKFPCGVIAQIDSSRNAVYGYDQRLEVFGSNGMLHTRNSKADAEIAHGPTGLQANKVSQSFSERYDASYKLEMEHFLNIVAGIETECEVQRQDTTRVSLLADACQMSCRRGKPIFIVNGQLSEIPPIMSEP